MKSTFIARTVIALITLLHSESGIFVFSLKEIGAACDPTLIGESKECGENAVCFRVPGCVLGVCQCRSPKHRQLWRRRTDCDLVLAEGEECQNADPGRIPAGAVCSVSGRVKCQKQLVAPDGVCSPTKANFRQLGEACNATSKCNIFDGLRCMPPDPNGKNARAMEGQCECLPSYQTDKATGKCQIAKLGERCRTDDECNAAYGIGTRARATKCRRESRTLKTPTCSCNTSGNYFPVGYSIYDPYSWQSRVTLGRYCVQIFDKANGSLRLAKLGDECSIVAPHQSTHRQRLNAPPYCQEQLVCFHCPEHGIEPLVGKCFDPSLVSSSTQTMLLPVSILRQILQVLQLAMIFII